MAVAQRMMRFAAGIMRYGIRASAPLRRALGGQLIRHARDGMEAHRDAMSIGKVLQDGRRSLRSAGADQPRRGGHIRRRGPATHRPYVWLDLHAHQAQADGDAASTLRSRRPTNGKVPYLPRRSQTPRRGFVHNCGRP